MAVALTGTGPLATPERADAAGAASPYPPPSGNGRGLDEVISGSPRIAPPAADHPAGGAGTAAACRAMREGVDGRRTLSWRPGVCGGHGLVRDLRRERCTGQGAGGYGGRAPVNGSSAGKRPTASVSCRHMSPARFASPGGRYPVAAFLQGTDIQWTGMGRGRLALVFRAFEPGHRERATAEREAAGREAAGDHHRTGREEGMPAAGAGGDPPRRAGGGGSGRGVSHRLNRPVCARGDARSGAFGRGRPFFDLEALRRCRCSAIPRREPNSRRSSSGGSARSAPGASVASPFGEFGPSGLRPERFCRCLKVRIDPHGLGHHLRQGIVPVAGQAECRKWITSPSWTS